MTKHIKPESPYNHHQDSRHPHICPNISHIWVQLLVSVPFCLNCLFSLQTFSVWFYHIHYDCSLTVLKSGLELLMNVRKGGLLSLNIVHNFLNTSVCNKPPKDNQCFSANIKLIHTATVVTNIIRSPNLVFIAQLERAARSAVHAFSNH